MNNHNFSAGSFLEFVNNIDIGTSSADITGGNQILGLSAVLIDSNKVFVAFSTNYYGNTIYGNYYLGGVICTIADETITIGTKVKISAEKSGNKYISVVKLSDNKVFIAYDYYSYYLYGVVCTIKGTTITAGTEIQLSTNVEQRISAVLLSDNKVFIAYCKNSNYYLYGIVCTINGTTITAGENTALNNSTSYTGYIISAVLLDEDKVFIAHNYSNNYYLAGMICTISGTIITKNSNTLLDATLTNSNGAISAVLVSNNFIFITFGNIKGLICKINNTTMTTRKSEEILQLSKNSGLISTVLLLENKVFIIYRTVTSSSNFYLYGRIINYMHGVLPITTSSQIIAGVAKTGGTTGQTAQVYLPEQTSLPD